MITPGEGAVQQVNKPPNIELPKSIPSAFTISNVPQINQLPELQRGCEVTSLTMLLNYRRIEVSKLTLAKQIEKVPFSYVRHGKYFRGNPNDAFVGDIYSYRKSGYGVYIKPLLRLANRYVGTKAVNLTGASREILIENLSKNRPILVIAANDFQLVNRWNWKTWQTNAGKISVSYYEHCFLLIGYDTKYFYVRDPLNVQTKVDISTFLASWKQFGNQAMTIQ